MCSAQEFSEQDLEFFETRVRPILVNRCFECHGPEAEPMGGGLNMGSRQAMLDGGDSGAAFVSGAPDESLFIDAINYGDLYEMPPESKMPDEEIAILTEWVKKGAPWPAGTEQHVVKAEAFDVQKLKSEHWCWEPPQKHAPPAVSNRAWSRDAIDQFILAKLESAQLEPAKPADRRTLVRRLYFDLIGLPPTVEEVTAFVEDPDDDAVAKVVDRLLADPRFGEHWARHWMDLVRYAETCGHEFEYPIPDAWRYRDYLIRAFNSDVPYDQFVVEHIAGDLVEDPRRHPEEEFNESILGTGFWYLGEDVHGPVDVRADLADHFENQIDVMSKTFLGLTVACARCHDHKFDAISTRDYYALAGFIKSSRRQRVMLDPGQKIERSFEQVAETLDQAQPLAAELNAAMNGFEVPRMGHYLSAAIVMLRNDPEFHFPGTTLQGENLKVLKASGGKHQTQTISPSGQFKWQQDKQLWWLDGKVDDELVIEFEVKGTGKKQVELFANFTKAQDYGAVRIVVDDQVVKPNIDFYAPNLSTTGEVSLGEFEFEPGKHRMTMVVTGHHENAIPRHMVGLDYLRLVSRSVSPQANVDINRLAAEKDLDADTLNRLVDAIKSDQSAHRLHPLHLVRLIALQKNGADVAALTRQIKSQSDQVAQVKDDSVLFADFAEGLPAGWFKTGFAFGNQEQTPGNAFSVDGPLFSAGDTVRSNAYGKKFYGVLRSPTFEITHDRIHYRIRGANAKVRLIIEGYVMDVYNSLLFKGITKTFDDRGKTVWLEQAEDIKNYKGLRAHIEIIDHSDGWVSVDEIRFSNEAPPREPHHQLTAMAVNELASGKGTDEGSVKEEVAAMAMARAIKQQFESDSAVAAELKSWFFEHELDRVLVGENDDSLVKKSQELRRVRQQARALAGNVPAPVFAVGMTDGTGENESVYIRGNHKNLGQQAPRQFLSALQESPVESMEGSGRMDLAQRLISQENPLTSRVIVNRIWHHLMGRGIVATVDNFGVLGEKPTHPELLDSLAVDFVDDGWSMKRLIRRILLSQTYQMASSPNPAAAEVDPNNLLLHRANKRRITSESIRDSMLLISKRIDPRLFGQPVEIHLTPFMQGRGRPGKGGPLDGDGRRSIYVKIRRNFLSPMMLAFDTPIPFNTVGRRNNSNVPAQALILMNDPLVYQLAEQWAQHLIDADQSTPDRIRTIYETAFARLPDAREMEMAQQFLSQQATELGIEEAGIGTSTVLWRDLCHVVFNMKQFIFLN